VGNWPHGLLPNYAGTAGRLTLSLHGNGIRAGDRARADASVGRDELREITRELIPVHRSLMFSNLVVELVGGSFSFPPSRIPEPPDL